MLVYAIILRWYTAKVRNYNEKANLMRENVGKRVLSEFLSFLKYKVDNDLLTMEEVESMARELADIICMLGCPTCGGKG